MKQNKKICQNGDSYFCANNLEQLTQKTDDLSNLKQDMADWSVRIPELLSEIEQGLIREDGLISPEAEKAIANIRRALRVASFIPPLQFLRPVALVLRAALTIEKILNVLLPGTVQELEICQKALNSAENAEKILNKSIDGLIKAAEEKGCSHV